MMPARDARHRGVEEGELAAPQEAEAEEPERQREHERSPRPRPTRRRSAARARGRRRRRRRTAPPARAARVRYAGRECHESTRSGSLRPCARRAAWCSTTAPWRTSYWRRNQRSSFSSTRCAVAVAGPAQERAQVARARDRAAAVLGDRREHLDRALGEGRVLARERAVLLVEAHVLEPAVEGALGGAQHGAVDRVLVVARRARSTRRTRARCRARPRPPRSARANSGLHAPVRDEAHRAEVDLAEVERGHADAAGGPRAACRRGSGPRRARGAPRPRPRGPASRRSPRRESRSSAPSRQPGSCAMKRRVRSSASRRFAAGARRRGFDQRSSSWR